ncbi:hypothetical protein AA313_de0207390 [Arthrobotrys entomopaga]|nr:hypothetical protein AA313_de0207390 [Arthrobotrys entomopaga]
MTAPNAQIKILASSLITSLTGFPPTSQNHALSLSYALKSFKAQKFLSTDRFAIADSLSGLEEKFRIHDNDILADELASRVRLLNNITNDAAPFKDRDVIPGDVQVRNIPDILRLLLELSSSPVAEASNTLYSLVSLVQSRLEEQEAAAKRLAEEEAAARAADNEDEGLWDVPDFAASSSDDDDWVEDEFTIQADLKERKKAARKREEAEGNAPTTSSFSLDDYLRVAHATTTQSLQIAQYWTTQEIIPSGFTTNFVSYGFTQQEISDLWNIGELHVIREVIFALYGLPSSLFKFQEDGSINVIAAYTLPTTSPGSLTDILDHFASKAVLLQKLRTFSKHLEQRCRLAQQSPTANDAIAPFQSFIEAIQSAVSKWELDTLVPTEEKYIHHSHERKDDVIVSLLQLQRELDTSIDIFTPLYEIIVALEKGLFSAKGLSEPAARVSFHLELLFKKTCEAESNGRLDVFRFLRGVFLKCLRVYLRPISKWMELGELREADGLGAFFVHFASGGDEEDEDDEEDEGGQLARLWRGRYILDRDESGTIVAPSFIREYGRKIFVVGKSVLFLRKLGEVVDNTSGSGLKEALDELEEITEATATATTTTGHRSLVSFNDSLLIAMAEWVDKRHRDVSSRLRDILYYECGLWDSLEAVVDVYFMRDGFATAGFCDTVFERMDKGSSRWDDRFLLTELVQSVYSDNPRVEIGRLGVKSRRQGDSTAATAAAEKKGVKALGMLMVEYKLSWPILNIFTPESVEVWKKVWGFMLMIRRSRGALEKMKVGRWQKEDVRGIYEIRWKLLTFLSLLQTFLVDLVVRPQVESLKRGLEGAVDIDEMIDVQEEHFGRMAELCLVSGRMAPLYQAAVSMMEVAVVLAGIHAEKLKAGYDVSMRNISFSGGAQWRAHRRKTADSDDEEHEDSDAEGDSDDDDDEGYEDESDDDDEVEERKRRRKVEKERVRREALNKLSAQAHKMIMFLTTGLRSMARAGVYPDTIEILAERLEMGVLGDNGEEDIL